MERRTADNMSLLTSPPSATNDLYSSPIVLPQYRPLLPLYTIPEAPTEASPGSSRPVSVSSLDSVSTPMPTDRRRYDAGALSRQRSSGPLPSITPFSPLASTSGRLVLPAPVTAPGRDAMGFPVGVVHDGRPVSSMHGGSLHGGSLHGGSLHGGSLYGASLGRSVSSLVLTDGLPPLPSGLSNPLSWTSEGSVASASTGAAVSYPRSQQPASRPATALASSSVSVGGGATCHSPIRVSSSSLSQQSYQYGSPQVKHGGVLP